MRNEHAQTRPNLPKEHPGLTFYKSYKLKLQAQHPRNHIACQRGARPWPHHHPLRSRFVNGSPRLRGPEVNAKSRVLVKEFEGFVFTPEQILSAAESGILPSVSENGLRRSLLFNPAL